MVNVRPTWRGPCDPLPPVVSKIRVEAISVSRRSILLPRPAPHRAFLTSQRSNRFRINRIPAISFGAVGDSPGDTYTLYVNQGSGLVDAIRYTVTFGRPLPAEGEQGGRPRRETLFTYEDYVAVDGLSVATRFRGYNFETGVRGDFKNEAWASEISFRQPFDASKLERPPDSRVQPLPESSR